MTARLERKAALRPRSDSQCGSVKVDESGGSGVWTGARPVDGGIDLDLQIMA